MAAFKVYQGLHLYKIDLNDVPVSYFYILRDGHKKKLFWLISLFYTQYTVIQ